LLLDWFRRQVQVRGFAHFLLQSSHKITGLGFWFLGLLVFFFAFFLNPLFIVFFLKGVFDRFFFFQKVSGWLFVENALLSLSVAVPIIAFLLFLLFLFDWFLFCLLDFAFSEVFPHLLILFFSLRLFFCFNFFQFNQKVVNVLNPHVFHWSFEELLKLVVLLSSLLLNVLNFLVT
jgi:hypothetical protein